MGKKFKKKFVFHVYAPSYVIFLFLRYNEY